MKICRQININLAFLVILLSSHASFSEDLPEVKDDIQQTLSMHLKMGTDKFTVVRQSTLLDTDIKRYKILSQNGTFQEVSLDSAGRLVSNAELQSIVKKGKEAAFVGKLELTLDQRLKKANSNDMINVIYWLKSTSTYPVRQANESAKAREARLAKVRSQVADLQANTVNFMRELGHKIVYQAEYAPVIVAAANPAAIRNMAENKLIERVYLEEVSAPRLNISKIVVQAADLHNSGINGANVRLGVVEPGRIGTHGNLPSNRRILCRPTAATWVSGHKTNVAGVVQSNHLTSTGMAPNVVLVDGIGSSFGDAEMMAATDCVISQGATAINMSFGQETNGVFNGFARYVDTVTHTTGRTIVVAISNICGNRMGSPEIAFNALAVGSFFDRNTTSFSDDVHSCSTVIPSGDRHSAFLDPLSPHNDREEPDIVAPGHLINTTNNGGGFSSVIGTSFAAPHVTGGIGLLQDRVPIFNTQNERARAILMASARHNIEGASRLSDRDGSGAIMLNEANKTLQNNESFWFTKPGGTTGFPHNQSFSVSAGQHVRVAVVWSHKMPLGDSDTQPTTDMDLTIYRPDGSFQTGSYSWDNSYEIVEFTAPVTGSYTARVSNYRSSAGVEYIGLAVNRVTTATSYTLTVVKRGPGSGTVFSNPAGINCGIDCSQNYTSGTVVSLTQVPSPGSVAGIFLGDPDCRDGVITMNANKTCEVFFDSTLL